MQNKYKQLFAKLMRHSLYGVLIQCFVLAPLFAAAAMQEQITVTGTVTSSDDHATLPGVNVIVKGSNIGTTTDADGKYSLQVPDGNATLVFSFIGFMPQE